MSETAIRYFVIFCDICVYSVDRMAAGVNERLSLHGAETHGLGLESVFNGVADPFEGLKTVHMQEKFYSEHQFGMCAYYYVCELQVNFALLIFQEASEKQIGSPYYVTKRLGRKRQILMR